ncbi:MAG: CARDB domain-containing protein [Opitutales bacterium]
MNHFSLFLLLAAVLLGGCQTAPPTRATSPENESERSASQSPEIQVEDQMESPSDEDDSSTVVYHTGRIRVTKSVTEETSVGGIFEYRITIEALDDVDQVRLTERLPDTVSFESAEPNPSTPDEAIEWVFASMKKGDREMIDVRVQPLEEGDHTIASKVAVINSFEMEFFAGQPQLNVVKEGPDSVELGEEVTWSATVTNTGSAKATGVVVEDSLPDAFTATSSLRHEIGVLEPEESETVEYSATADEQGEFRNRAVATYEGSGPDGAGGSGTSEAAEAPIAVVQSGIQIDKSGPEEAYVFKPEVFKITVKNTGDTDLEDVHITDLLPEDASVTDNDGGRVTGNAIGWMIPKLPAGAQQTLKTEIAATQKGASTNTAKVETANGLKAKDSVETDWLAVPGVTVSITDTKDPIREREETTYRIAVRNQGEFEPVTGVITVRFNDAIKPTEVTDAAGGQIEGRKVTFPETTLEPGKDIDLIITAEGRETGHGRAILEFKADFLVDPIISQETTNVY